MLSKKQMLEIAAFDFKRRTGREYDGRRYGSVTGANAPRMTQDWTACYGVDPQDVRAGITRKGVTRKCLRYNYIIPHRGARPDVTVAHVAVRLNRAFLPRVKEVARWNLKAGRVELRDIDYRMIAGWIVEWSSRDCYGKSPKGDLAAHVVDGEWYSDKWSFGCGVGFPFHETINPEALKGTRYEYCQYADNLPCKAGLVDWLVLYRQEPRIELLAKLGLYSLICPSGIKALKDKQIRDWVMAHRDEITHAKDEVKYSENVNDILYSARHGVTLAAAAHRRIFAKHIRYVIDARWRLGGVKLRLDYDRLLKAIPRWHVSNEEYARYLEYAHKSGLDLRNEGTLYPPVTGGRAAFMERLEKLEEEAVRRERAEKRRAAKKRLELERQRRRELADLMAARLPEIARFQASLERTKLFDLGKGVTAVLAKSQEELVKEGAKMHNCVGMGTYGEGIVRGNTLILMFRKDGRPFCDAEIDRRTWSVRQCYFAHNRPATPEYEAAARAVAAHIKKLIKALRAKKRAGRAA